MTIFVGTAGWSIPKGQVGAFGGEGTVLERYATRFPAVEINSSFYRPHRPATYAKWAGLVPAHFRFAVKIPKSITHQHKLVDCSDLLARFCDDVSSLGQKLGVLLVQLPPKLAFDGAVAARFFEILQSLTPARIVCEPRHPSWFGAEPQACMTDRGITRVAVDPAPVPAAAVPGGWPGLVYYRLHGSPVVYRSPYGAERVASYRRLLERSTRPDEEAWCIFDNTASSAATSDGLLMLESGS